MTVSETVLVFAGIPALIILIVGGLAYLGQKSPSGQRYRPGRPYEAAPVWFLAADEGGSTPAIEGRAGAAAPAGVTGGASDRW